MATSRSRHGSRSFNVLVTSCFSADAASFIDAMLGHQNVLPSFGLFSNDAIPIELVYGKERRLALYPSRPSERAEPLIFDNPTPYTFRKHFPKFLRNDNFHTAFHHATITCDLPLLKSGINLVNISTMPYSWGFDQLLEDYAPKADVIIYLINAMMMYTSDDKSFLRALNVRRTRNLIICYDNMGWIFTNESPNYMDEFYADARTNALKHTGLGEDAIHFIDSHDALEAKLTNNEALYTSSGMAAFEKFYIDYLMQ